MRRLAFRAGVPATHGRSMWILDRMTTKLILLAALCFAIAARPHRVAAAPPQRTLPESNASHWNFSLDANGEPSPAWVTTAPDGGTRTMEVISGKRWLDREIMKFYDRQGQPLRSVEAIYERLSLNLDSFSIYDANGYIGSLNVQRWQGAYPPFQIPDSETACDMQLSPLARFKIGLAYDLAGKSKTVTVALTDAWTFKALYGKFGLRAGEQWFRADGSLFCAYSWKWEGQQLASMKRTEGAADVSDEVRWLYDSSGRMCEISAWKNARKTGATVFLRDPQGKIFAMQSQEYKSGEIEERTALLLSGA